MSDRNPSDEILSLAYQLLQSGALDQVEPALQALKPDDPAYVNALHMRGLAHGLAGRIETALTLLEQAHRLRPDDVELAGNLAKAYARAQRYAEALRLNDRLLCAGHSGAERYTDCGIMLLELERDAEALSFFTLALEGDPAYAPAWSGKAKLMFKYEDCEEALLCYDRALLIQAGKASHHSGRGIALGQLGRFEEAMRDHDHALELAPDSPEVWICRAATLIRAYRPEQGLAAIEHGFALGADSAHAYCIRGEALLELNRIDEALQDYECALQLDPGCSQAQYKMGCALLSQGNYGAGWQAYEYRWQKVLRIPMRHQQLPRWSGAESLAGKRILLWAEQGFGDIIQHCRFAIDVQALGAQVVFETSPALLELCRSLPIGRVIAQDDPISDCDYQIPLASLPLALGVQSDAIAHAEGYLHAGAEAVQRWAATLPPARHALRIGIACSGYPGHGRNLMRSMPLRFFLPLADVADLFILQPLLQHEDALFQQRHPEILHPQINGKSFADTAGLVENLDLVISVDTSIAHLAASLGKPTWVLLDWAAEWRWMQDIGYSPWYRSARLFRQPARGDWTSVMRQVLQVLQQLQGFAFAAGKDC